MEGTDGAGMMPNSIRKVVVASFVGTTVGWYDYFIYGTTAVLVFPALFFQGFGEATGTRLSYTAFAALCLLRIVCYALAEETFRKDIDAGENEELRLVAEQRGRA